MCWTCSKCAAQLPKEVSEVEKFEIEVKRCKVIPNNIYNSNSTILRVLW